jgi:LacI family transcriptional regulator
MNTHDAPTMKDVAREAGVSLGTVSKVINGIPVGDSYRRKVEKAAKKLGYQVNHYARGLKTNKSYCIAFIAPSTINPFFAALAQEICKALSQRGYRMMLFITDFDPKAEQSCIQMIRQNKLDGAIGLTYNPDLKIDEDIPFVTIDRHFNATVPCVSSDNYGGGRLAAEKLSELGCKHLAFLCVGSPVPSEVDKRGDGFEFYCRDNGIPYETLRMTDNNALEGTESFLKEHMEDGRLSFDGIFCNTDQLVWEVQKILTRMGLRTPEDVQLIGFDGIRKFGVNDLYCSTIVQPVERIAETCVDIVLSSNRCSLPALVCLPVSYVPGGTTREEIPLLR